MKPFLNSVIKFTLLVCLSIYIFSCSKNDNKPEEVKPSPTSQLKNKGLASLVSMIRPDMKFGCHMGFKLLSNWDAADKELNVIRKEFNSVSIGIYQKATQKEEGKWKFSDVDKALDFAIGQEQAVYFHPMFGQNSYIQPWLLAANYTDEQIRAYMDERIATLAQRYAGKVYHLDVYNELIKDEWGDHSNPWKDEGIGNKYPTLLEHLFQQLGSRTVDGFTWPIALEEAFVKCRAAFGPDVKLIYNEAYNVNADHIHSLGCISLYNAFKAQGISIDGIGIQLHLNIGNRDGEDQLLVGVIGQQGLMDFDSFSQNMNNLAATGADIYVTECDVSLMGTSTKEEQIQWQSEAFTKALKCCLDQPACKLFKIWGTSDRYHGKGPERAATLWDANCDPKPAYFAMKDELINRINKQ